MLKTGLGKVERKVLGALMLLTDDDYIVRAKLKDIAKAMGYKGGGGVITYALQSLDMKNHISIESDQYKVLI